MDEQSARQWVTATVAQHPYLKEPMLQDAIKIIVTLSQDNDYSTALSQFSQSKTIAELLTTLHCDSTTMAAAILFPFFKSNETSRKLICTTLNTETFKLLQETKRLETIDNIAVSKQIVVFQVKQLDKLRRMLLAVVDDARTVLIKLAERLSVLISLRKADTEQQQMIAQQTMALYAPLANRLGIGQFKWQLEDWSFRYLDNAHYLEISKGLKQRRQERDQYIEMFHQELLTLVNHSGIEKHEISGRAKHIYSIHRKIKRKQTTLQEIYDSNAFRVLVSNLEDCYHLLSLLHEKWAHVPHEFDDYIAKPKPNGYQSIHTVVIGPQNVHVEIQIRTFAMHEAAELGVAAHWKYKENNQHQDEYENKITLLRDMMSWQQELDQDEDERENLYNKLFEDRVYVFTPNNDVIDLPRGATPLDAAYHIHTEVGHRCKGAKINGQMFPLTHTLKTGDVVEIQTSKENKPSRDWLNPERGYLKTASAHNKVKNWFHRLHRQEKLTKGQEIWEKAAKRKKLGKNDLQKILQHFNFKTVEDLLIALGSGNVGIQALLRRLQPQNYAENIDLASIKKPRTETKQAPTSDEQNFLTQLAQCCKPLPGDEIMGYITKGHGISIHRKNCNNIIQAQEQRPERILDVNWSDNRTQRFPIDIIIEANERQGLIRDISTIIANEKLTLLGIQTSDHTTIHHSQIHLTIEVENLQPLNKVLNLIQQLPDVITAKRRS